MAAQQLSATLLNSVSAHILCRKPTVHCALTLHQAVYDCTVLRPTEWKHGRQVDLPILNKLRRTRRHRASVIAQRWRYLRSGTPPASMCVW
ncbi:hypothetical protein K458DRAFT_165376 [Lentithecium fluviatile CBS 122367]|uniref:Uncharacterized protein n=1 Tax=Lentithecium fluviatile CBS 122367 TaxID=1168545 RepID=A0A6G1IG15_9PLEO|nr:hypothetical protein K458DRAFT_165376 [Lentithecium fluviatile CBS 122367]